MYSLDLQLNTYPSNLKEVEEIGNDLHDSEHANTGGDNCEVGVHVVVWGHLLILDNNEPFQEVVVVV